MNRWSTEDGDEPADPALGRSSVPSGKWLCDQPRSRAPASYLLDLDNSEGNGNTTAH